MHIKELALRKFLIALGIAYPQEPLINQQVHSPVTRVACATPIVEQRKETPFNNKTKKTFNMQQPRRDNKAKNGMQKCMSSRAQRSNQAQ